VHVHPGFSLANGRQVPISFGPEARMNNLLRDHN
jgi:hypothetical protein